MIPPAGGATGHSSPNHGDRRGARPDLVVLHYTAMQPAEAALTRLCDPASQVSAHYLIAEDGRVWRLVDESRRAWHAGAGAWGEVSDVNSRSIGVELSNPGDAPFPAPQIAALERLLRDVCARWAIPPERVIGHACMAPLRKRDPGRRFDWRALARGGLAVWLDGGSDGGSGDGRGGGRGGGRDDGRGGAPAPAAAFQQAARRFGYPACDSGAWDARTLALAAAFQSRFRPWEDGALTAAGVAQLERLAARWPVRRG